MENKDSFSDISTFCFLRRYTDRSSREKVTHGGQAHQKVNHGRQTSTTLSSGQARQKVNHGGLEAAACDIKLNIQLSRDTFSSS